MKMTHGENLTTLTNGYGQNIKKKYWQIYGMKCLLIWKVTRNRHLGRQFVNKVDLTNAFFSQILNKNFPCYVSHNFHLFNSMHRSALELIAGDQAGKKRRKLKNWVHVHSWLLRFFFIFANFKISRIFSNDLPLSYFSNRDDYVSDQICIKNHKALT